MKISIPIDWPNSTIDEIKDIIQAVEKETKITGLWDFIPKIAFVSDENFKSQGGFDITARDIVVNLRYSVNWRVTLAHELTHAAQAKKGIIPQAIKDTGDMAEFYSHKKEFEAENTGMKLYGTDLEKARWKLIKKEIAKRKNPDNDTITIF